VIWLSAIRTGPLFSAQTTSMLSADFFTTETIEPIKYSEKNGTLSDISSDNCFESETKGVKLEACILDNCISVCHPFFENGPNALDLAIMASILWSVLQFQLRLRISGA
jgi:hypothetical protein